MFKFPTLLCFVLLVGCGRSGSTKLAPLTEETPGPIQAPGISSRVIFVSQTHFTGAAGKDLSSLDALCQTDAQSLGVSGAFKALVSTPQRRACQSADCIKAGAREGQDWVLSPDTDYSRIDGTLIARTDERGIFTFPLVNPVSVESGTIWTGFSDYWTSAYYSFESCSGLTSESETGFVGEISSDGSQLLKTHRILSCSKKLPVLCVEQ